MADLLARLRDDRGMTLVELLVTISIMTFVMTGISVMFTAGNTATAKLTEAHQAKSTLYAGIDRMRTDVHLACSQTAQSTTSVTISGPPCDGTNIITWCTRANGSVYSLYRVSGSTCSGGVALTDNITNSSGAIFTYFAKNATAGTYSLPRLHIDLTVDANTANTTGSFRVIDDLYFLNGGRS